MQTDYPDYLIDAVPGARKLADEVDKLIAEAAPLNATVAASIKARVGKVRRIRHGDAEGATRLMPADGVTAAEFDALNAAKASAEATQGTHARKVDAAKKAFDQKMRELTREEKRAIAGPVARAAHAEAREALAKLDSALRRAHEAAPLNADEYTTVYTNGFSMTRTEGFGAGMGPDRALELLRVHLDETAPRS